MIRVDNKIFRNIIENKNFNFKSFNKELPVQRVSKGLTYLDIIAFHNYTDSRGYPINISGKSVENLYKKEGEEFVISCIEFLMENLKIPKQFMPEVQIEKNHAPMSYISPLNLISINKESLEQTSKPRILIALRHEIRHLEQDLEYYRCKNFGKQVAEEDAFSLATTKKFIKYVDENRLNCLNAKLLAEKGKEIRKYVSEHHEDADYISFLEERLAHRDEVIKHMGEIYDNSPQGEYIISRYRQKKNNTSFTENPMNYHFSVNEYEAYLSQKVFTHELNGRKTCFFSDLKRNNQHHIDELNDLPIEKQEQRIQEIREIIDKNPNVSINFLNSH